MSSTNYLIRAALLVITMVSILSEPDADAAIYIVTTRNDSGPGTLRQAINDANANPGPDTITFNLGGATPYNITPASGLPTITDPVFINGTTQPGWIDAPIVGLVGSSAGNVNGLAIQASGCEIRGLAINRFQGNGVQIQGNNNVVAGCYIGTSLAGTTRFANAAGVTISQGAFNRVGGTNSGDRNLISGNGTGLYIVGLQATNNFVVGNYIGTDVMGDAALGNDGNGVLLSGPYNFIGGTNAAERNVISGNGQSGVYLNDLGATGNRVLGNLIGLRANGTAALSNEVDGVTIFQAKQAVIGGTTPGARNVISGNHERGILIQGVNAVSNRVEGNLIGTDASGIAGVGNRFSGVGIVSGRANVIGGAIPAARNVISGNNQSGVSLESTASGNLISGNFIGLDLNGNNEISNVLNGISVVGGSSNVISAGNVISGNGHNGIMVTNATGIYVRGNLIGTDVTGKFARANALSGVRLESAGHVIGGEFLAARNVISGNGNSGVVMFSAFASNNLVAGNFIGTDITGLARLANSFFGVNITNAPGNFIGTDDSFGGNLISGNTSSGIAIHGTNALRNRVLGNWIGPDITGSNALANGLGGIFLLRASGNIIGGAAPGAGNVISGNLDVTIYMAAANSNILLGNLIGTRPNGTTPMPNFLHGIELLSSSSGNIIGGTAPGEANRIANAQNVGYDGIRIRDGSVANRIRGNSIYANGGTTPAGLGIDWSVDGVTTTNVVKYPTLASAVGQHITTIPGTLTGLPNASYIIDFYANSPGNMEPSGFGEGQRWIGALPVTTGPAGTANFSAVFTNALIIVGTISATTTDAAGTTSEFGPNVAVTVSPDTDGDGLPDDYEMAYGLNPNSNTDRDTDLDHDGQSNYEESRAGTRANDPNSIFKMSLATEPARTLIFVESVSGQAYRVEGSTNVAGPWSILGDNLAGTGARLRITDPTNSLQKYYRARVAQ